MTIQQQKYNTIQNSMGNKHTNKKRNEKERTSKEQQQ